MAKAVGRIAQAVNVPVSADFEAGYGPIPRAVQQTVEAALEAGAAGLNLEDATGDRIRPLFDIEVQADRIRLARETAKHDLVINARTDVYLLEVGAERARFDRAVRRANAYREAGADCLFVPGVTDRETIRALVKAIHGPLNVLAVEGTPPVAELQDLGVARVSVGSGPMRAALGLTRRIAQELLGPGTYATLTQGAVPYAEVNELLRRRP